MGKVSIRDLVIRLSGSDIISKLDLSVAQGEFLVLLGPSGCGKSTLLHSIAGLIDVHEGSVEIGGQDVTWADPKDRGIGMVFQNYALYPTMTVEKNMGFGPRIAGIDKATIKKRIARAAEMLQLTDLLKRKPVQLSGGQRQRVAIGRALVREAEVLLFDEPLSNLDAKLRAALRRDLKQLHKELQVTMIYVTHDQVEAMTLASQIAVMKDGKIHQLGTPASVYDHPVNLFVAGFLGSPSMNFFEGEVQGQHFVTPTLSVDISRYQYTGSAHAGGPVVLGVRPEDIALADMATTEVHGLAKIRLTEPMGPNQVVWLGVGGKLVSAFAAASYAPPSDQPVGFRFDLGKLSLFDAESQQRL